MIDDKWKNYFIPGTCVLKNKLGIQNEQELLEKEKLISFKKLTYLELFPINGKFDATHLKKIHHFLFDDIYYFAGEYRKCTMARYRDFDSPQDIEKNLNKTLHMMNEQVKTISSPLEYAFFLAPLYYDLMVIHPFREGNGRSVREFLREFVLENNKVLPFKVELDFSKIDKQEFLEAVKSRYLYPSALEMLFLKALVPINKIMEDNKKFK